MEQRAASALLLNLGRAETTSLDLLTREFHFLFFLRDRSTQCKKRDHASLSCAEDQCVVSIQSMVVSRV